MDGQVIIDRLGKRRNILLLQGPMGPFFDRLASFLVREGKAVTKINFNGGDEWFYRQGGAVAYRECPERWPAFFDSVVRKYAIDAVILFGDCRRYHRIAVQRARERGITVFVFEEGYIRPNYVTFEPSGVNGYSLLRPAAVPSVLQAVADPRVKPPKRPFQRMAMYAAQYYLMARIRRKFYTGYLHHKPFDIFPEAWYWLRAAGRKWVYRWQERGQQALLTGSLHKRFFLVPLQVYNDSQIRVHSDYRSVRAFIADVIASFACHAPDDMHLVLKQHPLDRGHRDYTAQIARLARSYGVTERVHYIHDLHLPSLLKSAIGTVMINSTTGLSSLLHGTPVKLMGRAIYDVPGLVFDGPLECFWRDPVSPDADLVHRFRNYLIEKTQVGGSFFRGEDIVCPAPEISYRPIPEFAGGIE